MNRRATDNVSSIRMQRPTSVDRQTYMRERAEVAAFLLAQGMSINEVTRHLHSSRPFVQRVADAQVTLRSRKIA